MVAEGKDGHLFGTRGDLPASWPVAILESDDGEGSTLTLGIDRVVVTGDHNEPPVFIPLDAQSSMQ